MNVKSAANFLASKGAEKGDEEFDQIKNAMIEFTTLHLLAANSAIIELLTKKGLINEELFNCIGSAYPLKNVK